MPLKNEKNLVNVGPMPGLIYPHGLCSKEVIILSIFMSIFAGTIYVTGIYKV